jgi:NAD(P)-dependent dehydrogenase (short-subunit alcohol dehydrogenase family)
MSGWLEEGDGMGIDAFGYYGKRVLVVGGASGMGAAIAQLVAELGGEVVVADRQAVEFPVSDSVVMDLREVDSIEAALGQIGGPIHGLFSCAGVSGEPSSPVDVMLINFVGARHLIEAAARDLMPTGAAVAVISSIGGIGWWNRLEEIADFLSTSDFESGRRWCEDHLNAVGDEAASQAGANYVFSKQAIDVYVQMKAVPFAHRGIRINATAPGPTLTPLMASTPSWQVFGDQLFKQAMQHDLSSAQEQAYPMVFLNSDAASHISGQVLSVDLGYTASGLLGTVDCPLVQSLLPRQPAARVDL